MKGTVKFLRAKLILVVYLTCLVVATGADFGALGSRMRRFRAPFWDSVARCETGGNWRICAARRIRAARRVLQRHLGNVGARGLGLQGRYPNAADAPRLVQIRVADYGYRVHHGYWGCLH